MERLLPDEYLIYQPSQHGSGYWNGANIKQEPVFNGGQPHETSSRAIMHVSCENQHLSAGIETVPITSAAGQQESVIKVERLVNVNRQLVAYGQHSSSVAQYNLQQHCFPAFGANYSGRTSKNAIRYCGVCGDIAKSFHFGGLSCDSCKAFFRRSVHNDNYLHFQCYHNGQCLISVANRKSCQYCRMKRCFGIGMEKSWVMTEEERKALMKTRAENRLKKQLSAIARKEVYNMSLAKISKEELRLNEYQPQVEHMVEHLSITEINEIESVVTKYVSAYHQVPYRSQLCQFNDNRPGFQVMEMFGTLIRRYAVYARTLDSFNNLPGHDQRALLKGGVMEMCILRGALMYDSSANRWPRADNSTLKGAPILKLSNMAHLTSSHVFGKHMDFIAYIQQLHLDEPTVMLLVLIVLFNERPGLLRPERVEKCQAYYTSLLERYMDWRYGPMRSKGMFHKLMTKLSDLRDLCDAHTQENMRLGKDEFSSIQQQLQHLKINPYSKIKVVHEDNAEPGREECASNSASSNESNTPFNTNDQFTQPYYHGNTLGHVSQWYQPQSSYVDQQVSAFESFQSSPASTASHVSSPGSCSVDIKQEAPAISVTSFAGLGEFSPRDERLQLTNHKVDGVIEAADFAQSLDASAIVFDAGQLSSAGFSGTHQQQRDWPNVGETENGSSSAHESSGSSLTAMEELFNDLERYSELHHYY